MLHAGFGDTQVYQSTPAQTIEQPRQLFGSCGLNAVEQNGFDDFTIQRVEAPIPQRDFSRNNVVPLRAQSEGPLASSSKVACPVPASQNDEADEQENTNERPQNRF